MGGWAMGGGSGRRTNEGGGTLQRRSVLNNVSHVRGELSPRLGYAPVRGAAPSRAVRALEVTESSGPCWSEGGEIGVDERAVSRRGVWCGGC